MLYQDYKLRIKRRVEIRKTLRRFRVPIICTVSAIIVLIAAFMITKGMIFGDRLEITKIEYGNTPSFSAGAVFSDVRYEFCQASGGEWTTDVPVRMGEYKMRVAASGVFGERYSDEQTFSIVPRSIEVSVDSDTAVYGENPTVTASLAFSDKVYCSEFVFGDTTKAETEVTPVLETVVIKDKNGNDVTGCYAVSTKTSTVKLTPRDVTITVEDAQKEYDGTILKHEVWQSSEGGLVYGDTIVKVDGSFSIIIGAGSTENKGQFKVLRNTENGAVDVTHHYNINQVVGTLTINQKPVHIIPSSGEFVYDGKTHSERDFEIDPETPLLSGHNAIVDNAPEIADVGQTENLFIMKVLNGEGSNVTDNYCFTFTEGAYIKVIKRDITVQTATQDITYDGKEHTFENYTVTSELGIAEGHSGVVLSSTRVKNAAIAVENVMELDIVNAQGSSVASNYNITYVNGTITVNQKDFAISSDDLNGVYNGRAQGAENVTYDQAQLLDGHTVNVTYKSSVTDCQSTPVQNEFTVVIRDENGENVTDNYNVNASYGNMQLSPLPIYIITSSDSKIYDGTELKAEGFTYIDGSAEIVGGQRVEYVSSTSVINAESGVENVLEIKIFSGDEDKTYNYDINYEYGTLSVEKRPIVVGSYGFDTEIYYDGEKHRNDGEDAIYVTSELDFALVEGHELRGIKFAESSYAEFATYDVQNVFSIEGIYVEGTDISVSKNYTVTFDFGILHLKKRNVWITSGSTQEGDIIYDGKSHSYEYCYAMPVDESNIAPNMGLASGHTLIGGGYTTLTDAGSVVNRFYAERIEDANGNDVKDNYIISYSYGMLVVSPRPVTLISSDGEKYYDGTPLTSTDFQIGGEGIVDGEEAVFTDFASITDVLLDENGSVIGIENTFDFDVVNGKRENYVVTEENYGTLTVLKRPITLTSQSASKIYDGVPLTNESVIEGGMGIADGQYVDYSNFASIEDVSLDENGNIIGVENSFDYAFKWLDGQEVPAANYEVTVDFAGVLTVNRRPVTVEINSISREYDGTPLLPDGVDAEKGEQDRGLIPGHSVVMELSGQITKVGSTDIGYGTPKIVDTILGDDKSNNYEVTVLGGTLTVTKRNIVLSARDEEQEYTGALITPSFDGSDVSHAYEYGAMGLGTGDTISVSFTEGARTELGTSAVKIKNPNGWTITNKDGEDVTDCYNVVSVYSGSLTVIKRSIVIIIEGNYQEYYTGGAITSTGYRADNFLYDIGHQITMTVEGEQLNVGTSQATLKQGSVVILDASGKDASGYYEIAGVLNGNLTVDKKRPVTVTSAGEVFIYDEQEHKKEEYTVTDNCALPMQRDEYEEVVFINDPMIAIGTYDNLFEVEFYVTATGERTTDNYDIEYDYGIIVIGNIEIEITTGGGEKVYDGSPLTNNQVEWYCPNQPEGMEIEVIATGAQTDVGASKNTYEIIASMDGRTFSTEHFKVIKEELGDLTVTPLELIFHTESAEKTYDLDPLVHNVYTSNWEETEASKHLTLEVETAMLTDIGRCDNDIKEVVLRDKYGMAVSSDNYIISEESTVGTLTMYADHIEIMSDRDTFEYDGMEKTVDRYMGTPSGHINRNHTLIDYNYQSFTEVGKHENTFEVIIVDAQGNSMMEFYPDIELKFDYVTITPREIVISAPSVTEKYEDGKILYAPNEIVLPNADLDELNNNVSNNKYGYEIDCNMAEIAYATELGEDVWYSIPVEHFYITLNGERLDMSNFTVTCEEGYLRLSDKLVEIEVFEVIGYYDGTRLEYYEDDWDIAEGQLPDGYWAEIDLSGIGRTEAGVVDFEEMLAYLLDNDRLNVYRYDDLGNVENATDLFEFKFVGTPLTVEKAKLVLTAGSASKFYDETPLTYKSYTITGGALAEGHVIKECPISGSITDVGTAKNVIGEGVVIVDMNNRDEYGNPIDVTHNYDITTVAGVLEVFEDGQE